MLWKIFALFAEVLNFLSNYCTDSLKKWYQWKNKLLIYVPACFDSLILLHVLRPSKISIVSFLAYLFKVFLFSEKLNAQI